jgi:hypothetical protein
MDRPPKSGRGIKQPFTVCSFLHRYAHRVEGGLENPSLIGASELSSRSRSGLSVLTPLLFVLLAEGLADLDGSACATLPISNAWF